MKIQRSACLLLLAGLYSLGAHSAATGAHVDYSEPLRHYAIEVSSGGRQQFGDARTATMRFEAFSQRFELALRPNRALLGPAARAATGSDIDVYRGNVAGRADSWVRLVVADGLPRGLIFDGEQMYAVEAANEGSAAKGSAIYRLADLLIEPGAFGCGYVAEAKTGAGLLEAAGAEIGAAIASAPGAVSAIDIGVVADFEFTNAKGANAEAAILTRMNNVDGIFSAQLGVQLNVSHVDTFAAAADPFSDESDSGALLDELGDFRFGSAPQRAAGLTHLFTGRNLDGTTVGVAFTGRLCSSRFGAGLTQGTNSVTLDSLIAAHEIGHNFGAPHDGTTNSACESTPQDFLMAPQLNGSDTFSACSITEMQDDVNRASCISPLASIEVGIRAGATPSPVLLGNAAEVRFDVDNLGTDTATNVTVDVTVPADVTLDGVSAGGGTCSSGAGSTSCTIASIAAGSGSTVTLSVTTTSPGSASFSASVAVSGDANGGNNQASSTITVDPAVDLVAAAAAAAQITIDQGTSLTLTIENRSTVDATNVQLTLTPDSGLRIDTATWSAGSCSMAAGIVSCDSASLASQATSALQISLTGISEGNRSYSLSVSSAEADRDLSNNDVTGQVTVNAIGAGSADDSGGGGALGWFSALLLLFSALGCHTRAAATRHVRPQRNRAE